MSADRPSLTVDVQTGYKIPTANQYARRAWQVNSRATKMWRTAAEAAWRNQAARHKPIIGALTGRPLTVVVQPFGPTGKGRPPDVGACAPAAKAIIDALTPAGMGLGLIPDDSAQWVTSITYLPQRSAKHDHVRVMIMAND